MPAENDWILYPPYSDKSLLRNVLAYRLSNDIGCYAPRTHFCELVLNGDYQGVYVLMEKIKRDKNRLDIATLRPEDLAGDQLTGGYVIKIDRRAGEENAGWISPFRKWAKGDVEWLYHDPGHDELKDEQKSYIKDYILRFEVLMDKPDWQKSYEQFLNVETFIDYYVLTELALNIDTYTFSTFFYKDRDSKGGKLCFGPVWDFNLAYGNADYFIGMQTEGWLLGTKIQEKDRISFWLKNLYDSRDIQSRITERWKTLREKELALPRILALVDAWVDTLAEAQVRNFERWPILGEYIWPNFYIGNSYEDEILYLKTWITKRWTWIDQQLQSNIQIVDPREKPAFHLQQNYPNPFNQSTRFVYELERDDFVEFIIYNSLGQPVRKLVSALQNRGQHVVQWDGCNEHKIQAPAGLYFAVLSNDESTHMIKMLLLP